MAAYCFCGCGRRVLFARKRFSRWGADATQLLGILEAIARYADRPAEAELAAAISEGQELWLACRNLAHGSGAGDTDLSTLHGRLNEWRMLVVSLASARSRPGATAPLTRSWPASASAAVRPDGGDGPIGR